MRPCNGVEEGADFNLFDGHSAVVGVEKTKPVKHGLIPSMPMSCLAPFQPNRDQDRREYGEHDDERDKRYHAIAELSAVDINIGLIQASASEECARLRSGEINRALDVAGGGLLALRRPAGRPYSTGGRDRPAPQAPRGETIVLPDFLK
jgi:hypothetical protein